MIKKFIAILLSIIIITGTFTISAFANEAESETESKSYVYCPDIHSEGNVLITQEEAIASNGELEATKLYPGDLIYFHFKNGTYINYNSNGGFSIDNPSLGSDTFVQDYISSQNSVAGYAVLGIGEKTSVGDLSLNFVHTDGDFLYWVVTDVTVSSTSSDNSVTIKAVWDVPESDGEDSEDNMTLLDKILKKTIEIIDALYIKPFYAFLKIFNATIRQPFFDLLNKLFGNLPL